MSAVDQQFIAISGKSVPTYVRHVDDYWVGGATYEQCEKHLHNLRSALKDYQLDVNEAKTRIISTKYVFGESWPSELERELRDSLKFPGNSPGMDPISTFGKIIDWATRENDDGIIKHAIRVIDERRLWIGNWEILEDFLIQCAVQFPHSFDYVARVIAWQNRTSRPLNKEIWAEVARQTALQSAELGRDSETAWALWLLRELNQSVGRSLSDTIVANSGALVLGFLAHFPKHRLATDKGLSMKLRDNVEGDPFAGAFWPLTLELVHLGIAKSNWMNASTPSVLRILHGAKVSMIDWGALPRVFGALSIEESKPEFAIEDYGSDYGEGRSDDYQADMSDEQPI